MKLPKKKLHPIAATKEGTAKFLTRALNFEDACSDLALICFERGFLNRAYPIEDVPPAFRNVVIKLRSGEWPKVNPHSRMVKRQLQRESIRNERRVRVDVNDFADPVSSFSGRPDNICMRNERDRAIYKALDKLDSRYRAALKLQYFFELRADEIAKILKIKPNLVRTWISRAKEQLRRRLSAEAKGEAEVLDSFPNVSFTLPLYNCDDAGVENSEQMREDCFYEESNLSDTKS